METTEDDTSTYDGQDANMPKGKQKKARAEKTMLSGPEAEKKRARLQSDAQALNAIWIWTKRPAGPLEVDTQKTILERLEYIERKTLPRHSKYYPSGYRIYEDEDGLVCYYFNYDRCVRKHRRYPADWELESTVFHPESSRDIWSEGVLEYLLELSAEYARGPLVQCLSCTGYYPKDILFIGQKYCLECFIEVTFDISLSNVPLRVGGWRFYHGTEDEDPMLHNCIRILEGD